MKKDLGIMLLLEIIGLAGGLPHISLSAPSNCCGNADDVIAKTRKPTRQQLKWGSINTNVKIVVSKLRRSNSHATVGYASDFTGTEIRVPPRSVGRQ